MGKWTEVTDPVEIARCYRQLTKKLQAGTRPGGLLSIGSPNGSFERRVRFNEIRNGRYIWIHSGKSMKTDDYVTLIGGYIPNQPGQLLIDLQFNFPNGRFNRQKGGAFIKDGRGKVYLGHRGIVTRGSSRVPKAELFRQLTWRQPIIADSSVKPHTAKLLLVGALDDERLVAKVTKFAAAMRAAATRAMVQAASAATAGSSIDTQPKKKTRGEPDLDLLLTRYRDEFEGKRAVKRKSEVMMDWSHGRVVHALHQAQKQRGQPLVCKAIDLVIRNDNNIDVFEVKPSSGSQSIYTAIGQLVFNGDALKRAFKSCSIHRYLVLPKSTMYKARQERCRELGFRLVTFELKGNRYKFNGLPE